MDLLEETACVAVFITFCGAIFISWEFVQWEEPLVKAHSNFPGAVEFLPWSTLRTVPPFTQEVAEKHHPFPVWLSCYKLTLLSWLIPHSSCAVWRSCFSAMRGHSLGTLWEGEMKTPHWVQVCIKWKGTCNAFFFFLVAPVYIWRTLATNIFKQLPWPRTRL